MTPFAGITRIRFQGSAEVGPHSQRRPGAPLSLQLPTILHPSRAVAAFSENRLAVGNPNGPAARIDYGAWYLSLGNQKGSKRVPKLRDRDFRLVDRIPRTDTLSVGQ